jgi:hypothetical protein
MWLLGRTKEMGSKRRMPVPISHQNLHDEHTEVFGHEPAEGRPGASPTVSSRHKERSRSGVSNSGFALSINDQLWHHDKRNGFDNNARAPHYAQPHHGNNHSADLDRKINEQMEMRYLLFHAYTRTRAHALF